MEIFSLGEEPVAEPESPGTIWKAVGGSATSFEPMPRKPPTLITYASILLPSLANRISLTSPTFWLSSPTTSVPLNFDAIIWSGFCAATNSALPALGLVLFVESCADGVMLFEESCADGVVLFGVDSCADGVPLFESMLGD